MNPTSDLSAEDIRARYLASTSGGKSPGEPSSIPGVRNGELTPTAKYVIKEVRKRLSQQSSGDLNKQPDESDLLRLTKTIEEHEGEELTESERTAVVASLSASLEHYDILTPLINNNDINDIIVKSYDSISIQSGRKNVRTGLRFPDQQTYKSFVENLLKRVGKSCTVSTPVVDAAIDPHVRACVTHESFSPPGCGPMLTLRVARHRNISLAGLAQSELAPPIIFDYLSALTQTGLVTMLIGGEVGTGKTTLVKALASQIDEQEDVLVIEDTYELVLKRTFVRTLLTREANTEGAGRITPAQAIRAGMRMAMNRIILGEMRDAEAAEAFIDVCASGHPGLSTIHARSAKDAINRLELFLARAQGNIGIDTIRRQIANAVSIVIYLGVDRHCGKRRLWEVLEVGHSTDGPVQVTPVFSYLHDADIPSWKSDLVSSRYQQLLRHSGIELPRSGHIVTFDDELLYHHYSGNVFVENRSKNATDI